VCVSINSETARAPNVTYTCLPYPLNMTILHDKLCNAEAERKESVCMRACAYTMYVRVHVYEEDMKVGGSRPQATPFESCG
jgi:hypothetical protein